jgi:hypothetical protein
MPIYRITAQKIIDHVDLVNAASLKEAEALIADWISDDFSEVDSSASWTIDIVEE